MQDLIIKFYDSNLDLSCVDMSLDRGTGAVYFFVGIIKKINFGKSVSHVKYNVFESLTVSLLREKCNYFFLNKNILGINILQRKGVLFIGDINLIVYVSAVDRKSAFYCCKSLVEYIKYCVPIWKKEYYLDFTHTWINSF